jgi:diaminohydroxyphosphoribosylaminopyrimidine deaminase/5-amino-6-(5-phosphoribosylamino)uracil reductase
MTDEFYIQKCLELAAKGYPQALPNPLVGCVIVYQDSIIGEGYHQEFGKAHAEVNAINSVKDKTKLEQSTLYVNLEPCAHYGKTPPCADLIIKSKFQKVVIGALDSFSEVNGKGIEKIKEAGIEVKVNILKEDCISLNRRFYTFHKDKRPYIILKWAKSSDGFIAPSNQETPFWMTSVESKNLVHQWRAIETGILIGKNTAIKDNPLLTSRIAGLKNPIRFVIDKTSSLPKSLNIFNDEATTYVLCQQKINENELEINFDDFIASLLNQLYELKIHSIIIEGGLITLQQFINTNYWDEARVFVSDIQLKEGISSPKFNYEPELIEQIGADKLSYFFNQ